MKSLAIFLLSGATLLAAAEQAAASSQQTGILGYLRPDGSFRPAPNRTPTNGGAATEYKGTLKATIHFSLSTAVPQGAAIGCSFSASVFGESNDGLTDDLLDTDQVTATVSGSTATCAISVPYEWFLYGSSDTVGLSYTIFGVDSNGNGRNFYNESYATIPVPANGATTTFSIYGRI